MRLLYEQLTDIPVGFTEVEYIEATGTQWLDIDTTFNSATDEVELYFQLTETEKYKWIFGEHDTNARIGLGSGDGTNLRNVAYYNNTYKVNDTEMYNSQHYFKSDSTGIYLNGTKIANYANFNSTSTLYLFNLNLSPFNFQCKGKVWSYRHKRNGTYIRDMIPCLDSSNVPCLYDKVEGKAYYNQGTGTFSYGRKIIPVEYIESTGTQYINTGIVAKSGIKSVLNFEYTSITDTASMLDARSGNNRLYLCHIGKPSNTFYFYFGYGSATQSSTVPTANTRYLVETDLSVGSQSMKVNGISIATGSSSTNYNLGVNLYLFGMNYSTPQYLTSAKLYYCKIMDGSILVRDYLPAIDENGVGFMFDTVTHSCYLNQGTGTFKYPAVECEYLEVTDLGTTNNRPCLNLGLKYKSSMSIKGKYTRTAQGDSGSVLPLSTSTTNPVLYFPALNATVKTDRFVWRRGSLPEQNYYYSFSDYPITVDFKLDAVNDALYVNGSKVKTGMIASMNGYSSPYESSSNLYMLSINGGYGGLGKVYQLKIYDTTQVYRDLIPAWKDGSFGMYDKEHDVLYTNIKSGTIVIGKIKERKNSVIRFLY